MPSNILALKLHECTVLKHYVGAPQAFAAFKKNNERLYREYTTFANSQEGLESLEYVQKK